MSNNDNYLMHYGVVGMRWGMRKAAKNGSTYSYKSMGQKKYEKKVAKLQNKVDKLNNKGPKAAKSATKQSKKLASAQDKLDMFKQRDINRVDYAKNTSVGKSFIKTTLTGSFGAGTYHRLRSAGYGKEMAMVGSVVAATYAGYPIALAASKMLENDRARAQIKARKENS